MSLEERRNRLNLVELFKISKGLSAIPWNSFFRADRSERTKGHTKKLAKESFRLDIRKHFFSQRVVNRWNALSEEVVSAGTVGVFKRRLEELRKMKKDSHGLCLRSPKTDSGAALVWPNQVSLLSGMGLDFFAFLAARFSSANSFLRDSKCAIPCAMVDLQEVRSTAIDFQLSTSSR